MQEGLRINNPIAWVHAQLQGGWRRAALIGVVYLTGVMGLLLLLYRLVVLGEGVTVKQFTAVATTTLLCVQGGMLVLVGASGVRRAVQRDFTSGMIDSHRLTPTTGWAAVFGYLSGPSILLVPLTSVNWLVATTLSLAGGHPPLAWTVGLLMLACMALAISSLSLLLSLCSRGSTNVIGLMILIGFVFGWALFITVPGLALLTGFLSILTLIERAMSNALAPDVNLVFAMGGQAVLAAVVMAASSRKYLRDDVQAFSWPLGLLLLAFASAYGGLGIRLWPEYSQSISIVRAFGDTSVGLQWLATVILLTLLALLPVTAAAQASARWERRCLHDPVTAGVRPMHWILVTALVVELLVVPVFVVMGDAATVSTVQVNAVGAMGSAAPAPNAAAPVPIINAHVIPWVRSMIILFLGLITIGGISRVLYRGRDKVVWFLAGWIVLAWIVPLVVDVIRAVYFDLEGTLDPSWLMGCSPVGALALLVFRPETPLMPGLVLQSVIALGLGIIWPLVDGRTTQPDEAAPPVLSESRAPDRESQ
ncbi:MAG: hypothetical protein V3T70_03005 [Phycisphaerae bacterium]